MILKWTGPRRAAALRAPFGAFLCCLTGSSILVPGAAPAQELELRRYANSPVDVNVLSAVYSNSGGLVWLDPALQIDDLDSDMRVLVAGYHRSFALWDRQARFSAQLPWADGAWHGVRNGIPATRDATGTGDVQLGLHWNFKGAPALDTAEFQNYAPVRVVGANVTVTVPTGTYDPSKLLNLGSNRWTVRTEIGTAKPIGRWNAELAATAWWFGDNTDFFAGLTQKQESLWVLKGGFSYSFEKAGMWAGFGIGFGTGGTTSIDGIRRQTRQENWRFAAAFDYPLARRHGIGLLLGSGITRKAGSDFDSVRLFYRYAWGG